MGASKQHELEELDRRAAKTCHVYQIGGVPGHEYLTCRTSGHRSTMKSYIRACGSDGLTMFVSSLDIDAATLKYCNKMDQT